MLGSVTVNSVQVPLEQIRDSNCHTVFEYWDGLRGGRFAPTWREFELNDLPPDCIRYTHVVDVHEDPFDITFRFWGTGLTQVLYFDRTGQSLLSTNMGYLVEARRQQVLKDYRTVIDNKEPFPFLWDASSSRKHRLRMIVPSLRLPISDDGKRVTHIVTHFDFTDQRDKWEIMFDVKARKMDE